AAATAATARTAAAAGRPLLGLVDVDGAPAKLAATQLLDGGLGLLVGAHLDEPETARPPGLSFHHYLGFRDRSDGAEDLPQLQLGGLVGKIANIKTSTHFVTP